MPLGVNLRRQRMNEMAIRNEKKRPQEDRIKVVEENEKRKR